MSRTDIVLSTAMSSAVLCVNVPHALLTLDLVLASTVAFCIAAVAVGLWTHWYGPVSSAAPAMRWNNRSYAGASVLMLGLIVQFSLQDYFQQSKTSAWNLVICLGTNEEQDTQIALAPLVYHFSKLYEYSDIILVLANHGPNYRSLLHQPIGLHFAFHHLTTPYLTWFRIIRSSSPGWEVFAGLNCLHHAIMYSFFGGGVRSLGFRPEVLRQMLPWTGGLQLVAGIIMEMWVLATRLNGRDAETSEVDSMGHWIAFGLLSTYLVLYIRDMRMKTEEKASSVQKKAV